MRASSRRRLTPGYPPPPTLCLISSLRGKFADSLSHRTKSRCKSRFQSNKVMDASARPRGCHALGDRSLDKWWIGPHGPGFVAAIPLYDTHRGTVGKVVRAYVGASNLRKFVKQLSLQKCVAGIARRAVNQTPITGLRGLRKDVKTA